MRSLAILVLLSGACGERVAFHPTENVLEAGRDGHPAASYQVSIANQPAATVDVWSRGAREAQDGTVIDMTIAIRNTSDHRLALDDTALKLETFASDGSRLPEATLIGTNVDYGFELTPGATRKIDIRFSLPSAYSPKQIGGLRLRWGIRRATGEGYTHVTELTRNSATFATTARGANEGASKR